MEQQSSSPLPILILAVILGLPLLIAFISCVRRIRMQHECNAAVAEAKELKVKYIWLPRSAW